MLKIYYLILIPLLFISCSDDISNRKFRNENYVFYQEDGKEGEWLKINPNLEKTLPKSHSSYFFSNGNRYAELEVIDSFPNRIIHFYDLDDKLTNVVKYNLDTITKTNYEEGMLMFYHSNLGVKSKEGKVINGLKQGLWKRYNKDGVLIKEYNLKEGKDHGKRIDYYPNGKVESISNWDNNMQIGLTKYFFENGAIKEINYVKNKKLHREFIEYYKSGQIKTQEFYWNGKLKDTSKYFYENGQIKVIQIFNLDTTTLKSSGTQTNYYPNGKLMAESTFNGKYSHVNLYYKNGVKKQVSEKYNNKHHGTAIAYHENGNKKLEGDFNENLYHGPFKFYSESGNLIKTVNYYYNEPIDSIMH